MKKILLILAFVFSVILSFAQAKYYTVEGTGSVTADSLLIINGDTIGHFYTTGTDTIVDKSYIDGLFTDTYVEFSDSTVTFVTPSQLNDSLQSLPGGHNAVTLGSNATLGGMSLSTQELDMTHASDTTAGWISIVDFQAWQNKISSVEHDGSLTGGGTAADPLSADTTFLAAKEWVTAQNYLPGSTTIPTISNEAYNATTWDGNTTDGASKNAIRDAFENQSIRLDQVGNPTANKSFTMGNYKVTWNFTTPTGAMLWNLQNAWSGHALEIVDTLAAGSGSAGDHLFHAETDRANVIAGHFLNTGGGTALEADGDVDITGTVGITGNISATNLSGTNTGDQTLSISATNDTLFLSGTNDTIPITSISGYVQFSDTVSTIATKYDIDTLNVSVVANTGKDTTGIYHANRAALDFVQNTNTGDVTLTGSGDYLSLSSQQLTKSLIDTLSTHISKTNWDDYVDGRITASGSHPAASLLSDDTGILDLNAGTQAFTFVTTNVAKLDQANMFTNQNTFQPTLTAGTYSVNVTGADGADRDIFLAGAAGLSNGFTVQRVSGAMLYTFNTGNINNADGSYQLGGTSLLLDAHKSGSLGTTGQIYTGAGATSTATWSNSISISGNINTTAGAFQLNGTSINTAGTLSNVAYKGSLTSGYVPYFTTQLENSPIYTNGTFVGIGTALPDDLFHLKSAGNLFNIIERGANTNYGSQKFITGGTSDWIFGLRETSDSDFHIFSYGTLSDVVVIDRGSGNFNLATGLYYLSGSPLVTGSGASNYAARTDHDHSGEYQLSDLSDVGVTTPTNRNVLVADGDSWESRALVEADISDLQSYLTAETQTLDDVLGNGNSAPTKDMTVNVINADSIHANWFGGTDTEIGIAGSELLVSMDSTRFTGDVDTQAAFKKQGVDIINSATVLQRSSNSFNFAHGTCQRNDEMYIGTYETGATVYKFTNPDNLESYTSQAIAGVDYISQLVYDSSNDMIYASANDEADNTLIIVEIDPDNLASYSLHDTGLSGQASGIPSICTDGSYVYGVNWVAVGTVFFKVSISTWAAPTTNSWTSRSYGHATAINTSRSEFYVTTKGGYFAKVATSDLSYSEVYIDTYGDDWSDDIAIVDDGTTCLVFCGSEIYQTNRQGGVIVETTNSNAVHPINLLPSYGMFTFGDGLVYSTSKDGYIQIIPANDTLLLDNIITYRLEGYTPNELFTADNGRLYFTNWGTGVGALSEFVTPSDYRIYNPTVTPTTPTLSQVLTQGNTSSDFINLTGTGYVSTSSSASSEGTGLTVKSSAPSTKLSIGYNELADESYVWSSPRLKFGTNFTEQMSISTAGEVFMNNIDAATSSNIVYYDTSTKELTYGAAPAGSGTVTSVAAGNGMNFTTITSTGSVTLGTPSSLTSTSTNSVTTTSHTHLIDPDAITASMINDNAISGQTELASGLVYDDELLVSDGGTIKRMDIQILQQYLEAVQSLSGTSVTMNSLSGRKGSITLSGNTVLTITNLPDGGEGTIEITNPSTYTLDINGSTGYTTEQIMGTNAAIASNDHTTVTYWRSGSTLYYGFIYDN